MLFPLLDHDDFRKSRKAVVITAIGLLAISKLIEVNGETSVLGIKIIAEKDILVASAFSALCYFLYVFCFRSYEYYYESRYNRSVNIIEEIQAAGKFKTTEFGLLQGETHHPSEAVKLHELSEHLRKEATHILRLLRLTTFISVDIAPAILISFISLMHSGGWNAFKAAFLE